MLIILHLRLDMSSSTQDIRIYGIRHHGPGSARRLLEALQTFQPDCLLIECPADGQDALDLIGDAGLIPPLALLIYRPDHSGEAAHLPFARFSPEWLAARYAVGHHVPVIAMDLPWGIQAQLPESPVRRDQQDPFSLVAQTMGYSDIERWWEYYFEQEHGDDDLFPTIALLMATLREDLQPKEDRETHLREAWMRRTMREYHRRGYQRIAVVCGAYHVPALDLEAYRQEDDLGLLQSCPAAWMTASTWVPWTYFNLANRSGYAAGVLSPAWYDLLFEHPQHATIHWMTRTAQLLRAKGLPIPPASVPAAVEMAEALATLRSMKQPGYQELEESACAVLVEGELTWLNIIREKNLIGDRIGKVPPTIPRTPLQEDFHLSVRSARLSRALETPGKIQLHLDQRKKTNHAASVLLHRLILLDLPWGKLHMRGDRARGRSRETWTLQWKHIYGMRLLEAGLWGLTLSEASHAFTIHLSQETERMAEIADRIHRCLNAELPQTASDLANMLHQRFAEQQDIQDLMQTLTSLISAYQYDDDNWLGDASLITLIERLITRIRIGLHAMMERVSDEQAQTLPGQIRQYIQDLRSLNKDDDLNALYTLLMDAILQDKGHPFVLGAMTRLVYEDGRMDRSSFLVRLQDHLRHHEDILSASHWCSGLLSGSEALLVHLTDLWHMIDQWIHQLDETAFIEVLPVFRKSVSAYSAGAKRQIALILAHQQPGKSSQVGLGLELSTRQRTVLLPVLTHWLNPGSDDLE